MPNKNPSTPAAGAGQHLHRHAANGADQVTFERLPAEVQSYETFRRGQSEELDLARFVGAIRRVNIA